MVQLSVKHGNNDLSPFAYSSFGITLSGVLGDFNQGYEFGQLGLRLLEKLKVEKYRVKVAFVTTVSFAIGKIIIILCRTAVDCISSRNGGRRHYFRCMGSLLSIAMDVLDVFKADQLEDEMDKFQNVFDDLKQDGALNMSWIQRQTIENLRGESEHPTVLKGSYYDEQEKG